MLKMKMDSTTMRQSRAISKASRVQIISIFVTFSIYFKFSFLRFESLVLLYFHFNIFPVEAHKNHLFNKKQHHTFDFASENCFARFFHAITTQCKLADYQVDGKKLKTTKLPMSLFEMRVFFTL